MSQVSANTARRLEEGMVESFRKYAYDTADLASGASLWEWLALAQVNVRVCAYMHVDDIYTYMISLL